jgi:molybdopterin synthase sulfur carrier subunit
MNATIDLKLFATLVAHTPQDASRYPITSGITIAQLIELLQIPPVSAKLIFINGIRGGLETRLKGGERVGIFPPVGGG